VLDDAIQSRAASRLAVTSPRLERHHVRFTDCNILYQFALPGNINAPGSSQHTAFNVLNAGLMRLSEQLRRHQN